MDSRALSKLVPPVHASVPAIALLRPLVEATSSFPAALDFANSLAQQPLNCQLLRPAGACLGWTAVALHDDDLVLISQCLTDICKGI